MFDNIAEDAGSIYAKITIGAVHFAANNVGDNAGAKYLSMWMVDRGTRLSAVVVDWDNVGDAIELGNFDVAFAQNLQKLIGQTF